MYVTDGNLNLISADQLQVGDIVRDSGATFLITSIRKHEAIVGHASAWQSTAARLERWPLARSTVRSIGFKTGPYRATGCGRSM